MARTDAIVLGAGIVEGNFAKYGEPKAVHGDGHAEAFERTATFDASFNRMLIYRGANLHSGRIPATCNLSPDPKLGRLTVNTFLYVSAPQQNPWPSMAGPGLGS